MTKVFFRLSSLLFVNIVNVIKALQYLEPCQSLIHLCPLSDHLIAKATGVNQLKGTKLLYNEVYYKAIYINAFLWLFIVFLYTEAKYSIT